MIKKNRNNRNAILTSEALYSVDFCRGPQIKVSVTLKNKIMAFIIWMRNFLDWKIGDITVSPQDMESRGALVRSQMKRRADTATFQGPVQEAMTLLKVKKTAPADVTVQHSARQSTRKKVLFFLPKRRQEGSTTSMP